MSRYALIRKNDIANGIGIRTTFWTQGCHWKCPNCHNKEQWSFNGGYEFTKDTIDEIIKCISADDIIRDFTILGGEPFERVNIQMCIDIVNEVKKEYPNIDIWIYTGYTFEELLKDNHRKNLVSMVNVIVDGLFIEELKDVKLKFRGSSNQRIIDVKESLLQNKIIEKKI